MQCTTWPRPGTTRRPWSSSRLAGARGLTWGDWTPSPAGWICCLAASFPGIPPLPGPGLDRPRPGPAPGCWPLDRGRGDCTRRWPRCGRDHRGRTGRPPGRSAFFKIGDVAAAVAAATRAIHLDLGDSRPGPVRLCVSGATHYWAGRIPEAWAALSRAAQLADEASDHAGRTYALGYLAVISAERGQLAEAERLIHRATRDRDAAVGEHFVNMMVSLATAKILSERGETAGADEAAHRTVVALPQRGAGKLEMAAALLARARSLQDLGDEETARTSVDSSPDDSAAVPRSRSGREAAQPRGAPGWISGLRGAWHRPRSARNSPARKLKSSGFSPRPCREARSAHSSTSAGGIRSKAHQRALYRKLQVADRAAAVSRARELELLEMDGP